MLHGTLQPIEDEGRRDYPDTLYPVEDTSDYEVRFSGVHLFFTTREAAKTVAHRLNVYGKQGQEARVIEWRLEGGKRVGVAL